MKQRQDISFRYVDVLHLPTLVGVRELIFQALPISDDAAAHLDEPVATVRADGAESVCLEEIGEVFAPGFEDPIGGVVMRSERDATPP